MRLPLRCGLNSAKRMKLEGDINLGKVVDECGTLRMKAMNENDVHRHQRQVLVTCPPHGGHQWKMPSDHLTPATLEQRQRLPLC